MTVKISNFLAVVCCLTLFVSGCAETSDSLEVLIERGRLKERQQRYAEAIEAYTAALKQRPSDAMLHYDRGVAYGQLQQFDFAIRDYTRALELDAALARAYNNRAVAFAQIKEFTRAIEDCNRAIELEPNDALAFRNRGLAHHDMQQYEKAIEDYNASIRNDGRSAISYFHRGNVYLELKKYDRAIEDYDQALRLDPKLPNALVNRATALAATESAPPVDVAAAPISHDAAAEAIVAKHFKGLGFHMQRLTREAAPWMFHCQKDSVEFFVLVKSSASTDQPDVEVTQAEIESARESAILVRLAIVTGTICTLHDNWLEADNLKAVRFQFSPRNSVDEH